MPLKSKPQPGQVEFFPTKPTVQDCQKDSTHFWIIGGQHTVEAHKVRAKDLPSTWTLDEISHFPVIPVWAKPDKEGELNMLQYSRGLNHDLTVVRKEPCFTEQIATCRLKWEEYLRPSPKLVEGEQSAEFKVSLDHLDPICFCCCSLPRSGDLRISSNDRFLVLSGSTKTLFLQFL